MQSRLVPARRIGMVPYALLFAIVAPLPCAAQTSSAPAPTSSATAPAPAEEPVENGVEGFRSARFGMKEAQLRAAIKSDFKTPDSGIKSTTHPVERTRVLQIKVRDLVASGSEAQIAYVLGFRSKTLMQVNILWSATDTAGAETLVAVANALRDLFVSQGHSGRFKKETVKVNTALPDGRVVVFRGADDTKRTVELVLAAAAASAPKEGAPRQVGAQLRLMYIQSPDEPDIDRPKPGLF